MPAKVYHADLFGTRAHKYHVLQETALPSVAWQELTPTAPFYLFVPQEQEVREEYEKGESIQTIFPINSVAPVTGRDALVLDFSRETLGRRGKRSTCRKPERQL